MRVRGISLFVAAAVCVAAYADNSFTNSFGYWSDASNWSSGVVPNSTTEVVKVTKTAVITNDVGIVDLTKLTTSQRTEIWGDPIRFSGRTRQVENYNNLYFYTPVIASNGLSAVQSGSLHFYSSNVFSSLTYSLHNAHHFHFHSTEADSPTLNWSFPPFHFKGESQGDIGLSLYGNAITKPVQELYSVNVKKNYTRFDSDEHSTWSLNEVFANGHVTVDGDGAVEVKDSRSGVGTWKIMDYASLRLLAPASKSRPAVMPDLHLDASRADLFEYLDGDPAKGVVRWNGVNGRGYAYHDLQQASDGTRVMPMRVENSLNGLAIVDFGDDYNKGYSAASERAKGGYLILDKGPTTDYQAWTVFVVECSRNFPLCASVTAANTILHGTDLWNGKIAVHRNETHTDFKNGSALVHLNCVTTDVFNATLSGFGVYDVLSFRMSSKAIPVGRLAWDRGYRTGAARVAEMLIYTRKLTDEEFIETEQYLREKWKGIPMEVEPSPTDHAVGTLHFQSQDSIPVEIESGADVSAKTAGGVWSGGFTGGGNLAATRGVPLQIKPFTVENGTLSLSSVSGDDLSASSADSITDTFFHLDAAVADSFTLGSGGEVLEWRDVNYDETGRAAYSPNDSINPPPRIVRGALNGLPAVDSGKAISGKALLWNHTNTTIRCVFLVYARPGGDNMEFLVGDTYRNNKADFHRGNDSQMFIESYVAKGITSSKADVRVNGETVDPLGKHIPPDQPVVVAINLDPDKPASAAAFFVDRWGHPTNGKTFRSGGQALCEAVFYDRTLDTAEFEAVQGHLIRKWLPNTPAAFNLPEGEGAFGELESTSSDGSAEIKVASGDSVAVGPLSGKTWTKTGGGTLVADGINLPEGGLSVADGEVKLGARELPAGWTPPPGAFRVDASDASTFTLSGDSVLSVRDADGGEMSAFAPTNNGTILAPRRLAREDLGGRYALDFGDFGSSDGVYGNCLLWNEPDHTVRTVFLVVNAERGFGMPIGTRSEDSKSDFRRSNAASVSPIWDGEVTDYIRYGLTRVDGMVVANSSAFPSGWHVLTLQTTGNCKASAFATDMYESCASDPDLLNRSGGVLLAEAIVYDALIDPAMRRDIEAYLMRKWIGGAPAGYAGAKARIGKLSVDGGSLTIANGAENVEVVELAGSEDFEVPAEMSLSVEDASSYDGVLHASSGSVRITGLIRSDEESVPSDGLIARFDMSATDLLETYEENGTNFVTKWYDCSGNHYAYADPTNRPWILKGDCNGLDVLCFGPFCQSGKPSMSRLKEAAWLLWDNTAIKAKTVIEVIGVQEGGGFLVEASPGSPCVHRNNLTGASYTDGVLFHTRAEPGASLSSEDAFLSINGVRVQPTEGFPSPSYHSFAIRVDETKSPGYFYIGQFGKDRFYRWGGKRICEVIAYNRCLTDDELARLEAYLQAKWFGRKYKNYVADGIGSMDVSGDAVLDLCGEKRTATSISGDGVVSNGSLCVTGDLAPDGLTVKGNLELADGVTVKIDLPCESVPLTVSGTVKFGATGTLSLSLPASMRDSEITLFSAGAIDGLPTGWTLVTEPALPVGWRWRVRFSDGQVKFKAMNPGTSIIIR